MHRIEIAALFDGAGRNAYFSVTVSQEEAKEIAAALRVVAESALTDEMINVEAERVYPRGVQADGVSHDYRDAQIFAQGADWARDQRAVAVAIPPTREQLLEITRKIADHRISETDGVTDLVALYAQTTEKKA